MFKFLGIGAQKAGTTWLYTMLSQHPDICFPLKKEIHFWNSAYTKESVSDYLSNFQHPDLSEGEITPAYAFLTVARIEEIYRHQPDLKIIYIIRNPIERAWSSAKMALGRAEMQFHEASDQWFIDHFNSQGSLLRGNYEACLRNWHTVFPRNQILTLKHEDIKQTPDALLLKCCQHIGIKAFNSVQLNLMNTDQVIFSTLKHPLNPNLHTHLQTLYQEKILKLADYLEMDLTNWK